MKIEHQHSTRGYASNKRCVSEQEKKTEPINQRKMKTNHFVVDKKKSRTVPIVVG